MFSLSKRVVALLGAMVMALALVSCGSSTGEYPVTLIEVGSLRSIEVLASKKGEENQAFYYRVKNGDKIAVPSYIICTGHDNGTLKFKIITARSGDLAGLYEERYPDEILALHDFSSDQTWPQTRGKSVKEIEDLRDQMLSELQADHPDQQLMIAAGRSCN